MAIRYYDEKNRYLSGYIVSGEQSMMIKKAIVKKSSKDSLRSIKNTTSSMKEAIARVTSRV
jgi:hypothetical protein